MYVYVGLCLYEWINIKNNQNAIFFSIPLIFYELYNLVFNGVGREMKWLFFLGSRTQLLFVFVVVHHTVNQRVNTMLMKIFSTNSHKSQYLTSIVLKNKNTITYSENRDAKHEMDSPGEHSDSKKIWNAWRIRFLNTRT